MQPEFVNGEVKQPKDAGSEAATIMRERNDKKLKFHIRLMRDMLVGVLIVTVLAVVGIGITLYQNRITGFEPYERQCKVEVGRVTIMGTRTFHQPFTEIQGHRIVDKSKILEKTTMSVKGSPYNVLLIKGKESKLVKAGLGEVGTLPLEAADQYVFVVDGTPVMVDYQTLCSKGA